MRARSLLLVLGLALAAGVWLALRGSRDPRVAPQQAAPASETLRPPAELAGPQGAPAPEAAEDAGRVAVEPAGGAPAGEGLIEIRDAQGAPVGAAGWAVFRGEQVLGFGVTTADGVARVQRGSGAADLAVLPAHHPLQIFRCELGAEQQRFTLAAGAAVAGVVLVDGFAPEEPFSLTLRSEEPMLAGYELPLPVWVALGAQAPPGDTLTARTRAGGAFRFDGLPEDWSGSLTWWAEVFLVQEPGAPRKEVRKLALAAPADDLVLALTAGARLTGTVVDPATGQGVLASIKTAFFGDGIGHTTHGRTEDDGRFSYAFPDLLPERVELRASTLDGAGVRFASFDVPPDVRTYDVGPIPLRATRRVAFLVRDEAGRPIEGAVVGALVDREEELGAAHSSAEGLGSLTVPVDAHGLHAVAEGHDSAQVPLPAGDERAVIVLGPGTVLELRLPQGLPEHSIRFHGPEAPFLKRGVPSWTPETGAWASAVSWDGERIWVTFKRPRAGGFVFSGVRPGLRLPLAVLDRYGSALGDFVVEALRPGEHRVFEPILSAANGVLSGRVTSAQGEPVGRAHVKVGELGSGLSVDHVTGADGRFRAEGLSAARVQLAVEAKGCARLVIEDQPVTDQPLELVLDPGRDVRVTISGPGGVLLPRVEPAWHLQVQAKLLDSVVAWAKPTEEPGVYLLERAPSAAFTLSILAGAAFFEEVCPPGLTKAKVELPAWQACTVSVEGWKQVPWRETSFVRLRSLDAEPPRVLTLSRASPTDEEVRFDVVFPGRYEVFVARPREAGYGEERLSAVVEIDVVADPSGAPLQVTLIVDAP